MTALQILGLEPLAAEFLGLPDGRLPFVSDPGFGDAVRVIDDVLATRAPDTILVPWRRDSSQDHRATWQIVDAALAGRHTPVRVIEYPVWAWMFNEDTPRHGEMRIRGLDIAAELQAKQRAIACYVSQLGKTPSLSRRGFKLPNAFLAHFRQPRELFFEDVHAR